MKPINSSTADLYLSAVSWKGSSAHPDVDDQSVIKDQLAESLYFYRYWR